MVAMAILPGNRITSRESRCQNPCSTRRASRSARPRRKAGASALILAPSSDRIAGSTISATAAAIRATSDPPTPIE